MKRIRTNNAKAWDSIYARNYMSGGTFLPAWSINASGSHLTPELLSITNHAVLEIGCGIGESVPFILKNKPLSYVGIDISENAIEIATKKYGDAHIQFSTSDISQHLSFGENHFDEIFSVYGIGWSQNIDRTLTEIYRILKPGGTFTFSWDHYLARVTEEQDNKIVFQNSYNDELPTVRYNWNQTGYNIQSFQAKPSTWFQLLKKTGFDVTAFHEITLRNNHNKKHVFSNIYSKNKSKIIPHTIVMQVKKPV